MPQRDWISTSEDPEVEVTGTKRRKAARRSAMRFQCAFFFDLWLGTRGRGEITQHTCLLRSQYASHSRRDYYYRKIAQFPSSPRNLVFLPPFQPNFPLVPMPISVDGSHGIFEFHLPQGVLLQHALKRPSPPRLRLYAQNMLKSTPLPDFPLGIIETCCGFGNMFTGGLRRWPSLRGYIH